MTENTDRNEINSLVRNQVKMQPTKNDLIHLYLDLIRIWTYSNHKTNPDYKEKIDSFVNTIIELQKEVNSDLRP